MKIKLVVVAVALYGLMRCQAQTQVAPPSDELKGLAAVSVLLNDDAGKAALGANYVVTAGIQTGKLPWPNLLPFAEQQQQALRDVFITGGNLTQLADGLGTTLGAAYQARFHYLDRAKFTHLPAPVENLVAYANTLTGNNSGAGKYFFANGTTNGTAPVAPELAAIIKDIGGVTDPFGKAYDLPAGAKGADKFGDSRPFQTEPEVLTFKGKDYFDAPSDNLEYLYGPTQDLRDSPSYPSGHTTYGYAEGIALALLVPQRYPQMVARAAEYGNDRIVMGAHYAMDVLGGRALALYDLAHLLAKDDFRQSVVEARDELAKALEAGCHEPLASCAAHDTGRLRALGRDGLFYESTQTYGLPVVHPKTARGVEDVAKLAPEAGYLLTAAFPFLTLPQADAILTATEGKGGGFLDDGSPFGVYSRLDLFRAGLWAEAIAPKAGKSAAH